METPNYKCSQAELYTIAVMGWDSAAQHQTLLEAYRPKYKPPFIADRQNQIVTARTMPTIAERNGITAALRNKLSNMNRICLRNFQSLKRYITGIYEKDLWQIEFNTAGQQFYEDGLRKNWDSTTSLLDTATNYLHNRNAMLIVNDNMPVTFKDQFQNDRQNFMNAHKDFLESEEMATIGTEEKVKLNNLIYAELTSLFADAVIVFTGEHAKRKQFIFSDLLYLASGAGTAGVRGFVSDVNTGMPIEDALITVIETNEADTSVEEGKYEISPMAAGFYTLRVIADHYEEKIIPHHEVKTGTTSTFNIHLLPAA